MKFTCLSDHTRNNVATDIIISLVIYVTLFMVLSSLKILIIKKIFCIVNTVVFTCIQLTRDCIYIRHSMVVYSVNAKANLHIEL